MITGFRDDGIPVNPSWGRDDYPEEPEAGGELRDPVAPSLDVQRVAAPEVCDEEEYPGYWLDEGADPWRYAG